MEMAFEMRWPGKEGIGIGDAGGWVDEHVDVVVGRERSMETAKCDQTQRGTHICLHQFVRDGFHMMVCPADGKLGKHS